MITIDSFAPVPDSLRGAFLAVGNFDGVHRGHAHLVDRLVRLALLHDAPAILLTFDPQPVALLRPESAPVPLTWLERKVELLRQAGASEVGVFRTGPWLLGLTAREFFDRVVIAQFGARGMVEGPTFGFGRDRGGDAQTLGEWCSSRDLAFEIASPTEVAGRIVSSSRVRQALAEGDAAEASLLLGRPHRVRGRVARGAGRGAGLGFPTANLAGIDTQIPADGVYAMRVRVAGSGAWHPAAAHVGANATFGEKGRTVEVHLLDFQGDLYGQTLECDVVERLRGTVTFAGMKELLVQIGLDVERARALLES